MLRLIAKTVAVVALLTGLTATAARTASPTDQEVCNVPADLALGLDDYGKAVELHLQLLRSHPNDALAHYHLGFAYGMMGLDTREVDEYLTAVRLGLRQWDLYLNLGLVYLERHELANAALSFEIAARLGPERIETHFNLAIAYEKEGRFDDALREISVARHLAPTDLDIANANAIICVETGDLAGAHDLWTHLVETAPNYAPARTNLMILRGWATPDGQPERDTEAADAEPEFTAGNVRTITAGSNATVNHQ
jgi:Flp pilus assembly protein TadD